MKTFLLATCLSAAVLCAPPASAANPQQSSQLRAIGQSLPTSVLDEAAVAAAVRREQAAGTLDLAGMPVEDAVMLAFLLISEDADAELRGLLQEMDATRKGKQGQREEAVRLTKQAGKQRADLRQAYAVRGPGKLVPTMMPGGTPAPSAGSPVRIERARIDATVERARGGIERAREGDDMSSVRLQSAMQRMSKTNEILSSLLKKSQETSRQVIQNIK